MKRRYHIAGATPDGRTVFEDCQSGKKRTMEAVQEGKPIPADAELAMVLPDEDGHHVTMEDVGDLRSGPVQVATPAYRSGWDRTFGSALPN